MGKSKKKSKKRQRRSRSSSDSSSDDSERSSATSLTGSSVSDAGDAIEPLDEGEIEPDAPPYSPVAPASSSPVRGSSPGPGILRASSAAVLRSSPLRFPSSSLFASLAVTPPSWSSPTTSLGSLISNAGSIPSVSVTNLGASSSAVPPIPPRSGAPFVPFSAVPPFPAAVPSTSDPLMKAEQEALERLAKKKAAPVQTAPECSPAMNELLASSFQWHLFCQVVCIPRGVGYCERMPHMPQYDKRSPPRPLPKTPYLVDHKLIPRILGVIDEKRSEGDIDDNSLLNIDEMISELETRFPEYKRKKKRAFRKSVEKSYAILRQDLGLPSSDSDVEALDDEDDDVPTVLNEVYADLQKKSMNSRISVLYSSSACPSSSSKEAEESTAPPPKKKTKLNVKSTVKDEKTAARKPRRSPHSREVVFTPEPSNVKFSDIGGVASAVKEIKKLVFHMERPEIFEQLGVPPPRGFLLHGPPGSGKTLLGRAVAGELGIPLLKIAATEIVSGVSGESEERLRDVFNAALESSPCVLFVDEIDAITPKRETAGKEMERRVVAQLVSCLDDMASHINGKKVVVVGATSRPDSLDPGLRRGGRFDREISLGIPDVRARVEILQILCRDLKLAEDFSFEDTAKRTPGFVGADLAALTREAAMVAVDRSFSSVAEGTVQVSDLRVTASDFVAALRIVQPSAKREGFATVPDVTWDDVGALAEIREELEVSIMAPVRFPDEFEALGLGSPSGVLLCGPPGCGKTLLAKAVANEAGINFISVKGPELLNMYVGESERAVRACFLRARNSAPCVIFFDELDSLCPRRSSGSSGDGGASSRVVNQLLTEMDGVDGRRGVFVMAATNRPDILDPAVLRPGRLDKMLYVGLPNADDRADILFALTKSGTKPKLAAGVNLAEIGRSPRCDGFSGADLAALVREASVAALKEVLKSSEGEEESKRKKRRAAPVSVGIEHFETAFRNVVPSIGPEERKKYDALRTRLSKGKLVT